MTATSLNAADFGLTPGASADQSNILNTAIDAAATQRLPLFIPAGTYRITEAVVGKPVEIYAASGSAVFIPVSGSETCRFAIAPASGRLADVTLRGLRIDGQHAPFPNGYGTPGLINASKCDRLQIIDCQVVNSGASGLFLWQCGGRIQGCEANSNASRGIFSVDATGLSILSNRLDGNQDNGIAVWRYSIGRDGTIVRGNRISNTGNVSGGTGQYGNGFSSYRANNLIVAENEITASAFSAIRLNSCSASQVINNQCFDAPEVAIYVEAPNGSSNPTIIYDGGIVSGNIVDLCGVGISVTNVDAGGRRAVVANNQVTRARDNTITYPGGSYQTYGKGIGGQGDVLITGNMVEDVQAFGISVFPTNVNSGKLGNQKIFDSVTGNTVKKCGGGIALVNSDANHGRILVGGNIINDYKTDGSGVSGAIVRATYNGATDSVQRVPGSPDLGNDTTSSLSNVVLYRNYAFN